MLRSGLAVKVWDDFGEENSSGLRWMPVSSDAGLLGPTVAKHVHALPHARMTLVDEADFWGADLCARHGVDGAKTVLFQGGPKESALIVACVAPIGTDIDTKVVSEHLGVSRRSVTTAAEAYVRDAQMEKGGVTPFGLPLHWRLLVDASLQEKGNKPVVIGGGRSHARLWVSCADVLTLPRVEVVAGLARVNELQRNVSHYTP